MKIFDSSFKKVQAQDSLRFPNIRRFVSPTTVNSFARQVCTDFSLLALVAEDGNMFATNKLSVVE